MRLERRGRVKPLQTSFNWQQEETDDCDKTVHHPETTGVRRLEGGQGQCGVCRRGQGDDRRLRSGLEEQSVSDLEPDVVGKLFSGSSFFCVHSFWKKLRAEFSPMRRRALCGAEGRIRHDRTWTA